MEIDYVAKFKELNMNPVVKGKLLFQLETLPPSVKVKFFAKVLENFGKYGDMYVEDMGPTARGMVSEILESMTCAFSLILMDSGAGNIRYCHEVGEDPSCCQSAFTKPAAFVDFEQRALTSLPQEVQEQLAGKHLCDRNLRAAICAAYNKEVYQALYFSFGYVRDPIWDVTVPTGFCRHDDMFPLLISQENIKNYLNKKDNFPHSLSKVPAALIAADGSSQQTMGGGGAPSLTETMTRAAANELAKEAGKSFINNLF